MSESLSELLEYFLLLTKQEPGNAQAQRGVALAREWSHLVERGGITKVEFKNFLDRVEAPENHGYLSWTMFWAIVRGQGYELNFNVPDQYPRTIDRNKVSCISNGEYTDQLTVEKEYEIRKEDTEQRQLRIENDVAKARWYPTTLFNRIVVPERTWSRKEDK